jgi:hypothetical protein
MYEWDQATAATALQPIFAASWFAKAIVPKLRIRTMTRDEAVSDLAQAAKVGPTYRNQLRTLLFYLEACGLIEERDGKLMATKAGPQPQGPPEPTESPQNGHAESNGRHIADSQVTASTSPPFGLMGEHGAVQFSINVRVDMKEFAGWTGDRITAFFGGIAAVLAARGEEKAAVTD